MIKLTTRDWWPKFRDWNVVRMLSILKKAILLSFFLLLLPSCSKQSGSGSNGDSTVTLSGVVQAGRVAGGTVNFYTLNSVGARGSLIASTTTDQDGNYSANINPNSGPIEVVVTGGSYLDEATGLSVSLSAGQELTNLVSTVTSPTSVAVTPITSQVAVRVKANLSTGVNFETVHNAAKTEVAQIWGTSPSIIDTIPSSPHENINGNSEAGKAAFLLATLSQYMKNQGQSPANGISPISFLNKLNQDFAIDGKLDGKDGSTNLESGVSNFATGWAAGFASAMNDVKVNPNLGAFSAVNTDQFDDPTPLPDIQLGTSATSTSSTTGSSGTLGTTGTAGTTSGSSGTSTGSSGSSGSAGVSGSTGSSASPGTFTATGALRTGRYNSLSVALTNGKVLVIGGTDNSGNKLQTIESYDPSTGLFSAVGQTNALYAPTSATLLNSGKILLLGGRDSNNWTTKVAELYDPTTGLSSATGSMVVDRGYGFTATLLASGKVLVLGGVGQGCPTDNTTIRSAELYDPATGVFSAIGNMNVTRGGHSAVLMADGRVLVSGGNYCYRSGLFGWTSSDWDINEIYDPNTGIFTPTGNLSSARHGHQSLLLPDGRVALVSGYLSTNVAQHLDIYNPTTGLFTSGPWVPSWYSGAAAVLANGKIMVLAGEDAYLITLATSDVSATGKPTEGRAYSSIAPLNDGTFLIISGGFDSIATADVYHP